MTFISIRNKYTYTHIYTHSHIYPTSSVSLENPNKIDYYLCYILIIHIWVIYIRFTNSLWTSFRLVHSSYQSLPSLPVACGIDHNSLARSFMPQGLLSHTAHLDHIRLLFVFQTSSSVSAHSFSPLTSCEIFLIPLDASHKWPTFTY